MMPSSRARSSRSPSPTRKRPKIFRACAACVSSKTRCDDVSPAGCALCRRRGKECSLAAIAGAYEAPTSHPPHLGDDSSPSSRRHSAAPPSNPHPHPHPHPHQSSALGLGLPPAYPPPRASAPPSAAYPTPDYGEDRDIRARLAETEHRLSRTERALADLEARLPSREREGESPEDAGIIFAGPLRLSALQLEGHDETIWSVACTRGYPDPVARGLLSPAEAELVWHGFKARVARLLPIPPFTAVSTPVPEHGFVMLAALHHVPALVKDQARLRRMVDESMGLAMASHATVDVVLALLILSLAPPLPDDGGDTAPTNATAWRMISLARSMCMSMGLEARAIAAVRKGADLNHEVWADSLWIMQLWCAVSNRYALLSFMYPQGPPPTPLALRLPRLQREQLEAANVHLRAEADMVMAFSPFVELLSGIERETEWVQEDLRELVALWDKAKDTAMEVANANPQSPTITIDARCIEFALSIRLGLFGTWIPSPLKDARETVLHCMRKFPRNMTAMLDIVTPSRPRAASPGPPGPVCRAERGQSPLAHPVMLLDPALVPEQVIVMVSAAVITFRRSVRYVAIAYPGAKLIEGGRLDEAARTVQTLGRAARFIVTQGEKLLGDMEYSPKWAHAEPPSFDPAHEKGNGHGHGHQQPRTDLPFFDLDVMNWDLSVLYPDLATMDLGGM